MGRASLARRFEKLRQLYRKSHAELSRPNPRTSTRLRLEKIETWVKDQAQSLHVQFEKSIHSIPSQHAEFWPLPKSLFRNDRVFERAILLALLTEAQPIQWLRLESPIQGTGLAELEKEVHCALGTSGFLLWVETRSEDKNASSQWTGIWNILWTMPDHAPQSLQELLARSSS
jgi:hypothetical protein